MKPLPVLSDMPVHIKALIAQNLALFPERLALRKVSKDFKEIVDSSRAKIDMTFRIMHGKIGLTTSFGDRSIVYFNVEKGCMKRVYEDGQVLKEEFFEGEHYMDKGLLHFQRFVSRPKLSFDGFGIGAFYPEESAVQQFEEEKNEILKRVEMILKNLPFRIKVDAFHMFYNGQQEDVLRVLPYLDPESIDFFEFTADLNAPEAVVNFAEIAELEQWSKARGLRVIGFPVETIPVEKIARFQKLEVSITSPDYFQALVNQAQKTETPFYVDAEQQVAEELYRAVYNE